MIEAEWWDYDSPAEMGPAVAGDVAFIIERAIASRGAALIVVPGGSTPGPAFAALAKAKLDWEKVTILPGDERLADPEGALSNGAAIAKAFAKTAATVICPVEAADLALDYKAAGRAADARAASLAWPPDLVWLGMGADGHTASIFTGGDLAIALDAPVARRFVGVTPDPLPAEAPVARVTLTRPAILSARALMMTVSGDAKRELLEHEIEQGPSARTPVGRVLADAETPIDIHWCP